MNQENGTDKILKEHKTGKDYYKAFKTKHDTTAKTLCVCGGTYSYYTKSNHLKSKQHTKHIIGEKQFLKQKIENLQKQFDKLDENK